MHRLRGAFGLRTRPQDVAETRRSVTKDAARRRTNLDVVANVGKAVTKAAGDGLAVLTLTPRCAAQARSIKVGAAEVLGWLKRQAAIGVPFQIVDALAAAQGMAMSLQKLTLYLQELVVSGYLTATSKGGASKSKSDAVPDAVEPTIVPAGPPSVINSPAAHGNQSGVPFAPLAQAACWMAIHGLFVQAGRVPVSFVASEIAGLTGLSVQEVNQAVQALLATGQLATEPNRSGSALPRYYPVL